MSRPAMLVQSVHVGVDITELAVGILTSNRFIATRLHAQQPLSILRSEPCLPPDIDTAAPQAARPPF
eukprot:scaffold55523_cov32-Tisochrysis_lutea.AAC.4